MGKQPSESGGISPYDGVLVFSFGGPERVEDVMPFMRSVTAGRGIPDERLTEVAGHYYARGGRSPINDETRSLVAGLQGELDARGYRVPVLWGNRHATPTLEQALNQARDDGLQRLVAVVTSAYPGYASCRLYRDHLAAGAAQVGVTIDSVRRFAHHPGFSRTVTRLVVEHTRRLLTDLRSAQGCRVPEEATRLVFVTHSIPVWMDAASGPPDGGGHWYTRHHRQLAEAVATEVNTTLRVNLDWELVFCSRSGPPRQPWLEPDVNDYLHEAAAAGCTGVVLIPLGFVADHMEVVYDLDEQAMGTARDVGLRAVRVPTARADSQFVAGLVDLVEERAALARGEPVIGQSWPEGWVLAAECDASCCPAPQPPPISREPVGRR